MKKACIFVFLLVCACGAVAQQTGGVFPPMVNEGHSSWQYRAAYNPDTDGFAQRLHYQQAIDGDLMWRILGQTRKTDSSDFDFDFLQAELFWELSGDDERYRSGFRFDARLRDNNRPHQIGWNWMNQFFFDDGWSARALLLTTYQFGNNAADGLGLGTRAQLVKRLSNGHSVGLEWYSAYGTTDDFADLDDQNHALGPVYSLPIAEGWSVFGGLLFGLTDASSDAEGRVWITKSM